LLVAGLAAAGVLLAGPGYRFGGWGLGLAFTLLRWGAQLGAVAAALAVVALVVSLSRRGRRHVGLAALALIIGLAAFAIPWRMQVEARRVPAIHDVTTDPEDPPAFVAVVARRQGARNPVEYGGPAVAAQQRRAFPDIRPFDVDAPPERAFAAAEAAARKLGWEIVAAAPGEGRLEATATTRWFGFRRGRSRRQRRTGPRIHRAPPGGGTARGLTPRDPVV
jgi:hypothetical protein